MPLAFASTGSDLINAIKQVKEFGLVTIHPDGRAVHDMHRFRVKGPADSRGKYNDYIHVLKISAAEAFRPLNAGSCRLVQ